MALDQLPAFMAAIRALESGGGDPRGDYTAQGPRITNPNSQYYGERAQGAYQIMPGNWPSWSRAAGVPGANISDPAAQDAVARYMFISYYNLLGSWDAVAVAWFSGMNNAKKFLAGNGLGGVNDGNMNVPDYVKTIRGYMARFGDSAPGTRQVPGGVQKVEGGAKADDYEPSTGQATPISTRQPDAGIAPFIPDVDMSPTGRYFPEEDEAEEEANAAPIPPNPHDLLALVLTSVSDRMAPDRADARQLGQGGLLNFAVEDETDEEVEA